LILILTKTPLGLGFEKKKRGLPTPDWNRGFYFTVQAPGIFYLQKDGILYAWKAKMDEK